MAPVIELNVPEEHEKDFEMALVFSGMQTLFQHISQARSAVIHEAMDAFERDIDTMVDCEQCRESARLLVKALRAKASCVRRLEAERKEELARAARNN